MLVEEVAALDHKKLGMFPSREEWDIYHVDTNYQGVDIILFYVIYGRRYQELIPSSQTTIIHHYIIPSLLIPSRRPEKNEISFSLSRKCDHKIGIITTSYFLVLSLSFSISHIHVHALLTWNEHPEVAQRRFAAHSIHYSHHLHNLVADQEAAHHHTQSDPAVASNHNYQHCSSGLVGLLLRNGYLMGLALVSWVHPWRGSSSFCDCGYICVMLAFGTRVWGEDEGAYSMRKTRTRAAAMRIPANTHRPHDDHGVRRRVVYRVRVSWRPSSSDDEAPETSNACGRYMIDEVICCRRRRWITRFVYLRAKK